MIDSSVDYKNLPRPTWAEIDIDAILNEKTSDGPEGGKLTWHITLKPAKAWADSMIPITAPSAPANGRALRIHYTISFVGSISTSSWQ